jgi:hypothetical protein
MVQTINSNVKKNQMKHEREKKMHSYLNFKYSEYQCKLILLEKKSRAMLVSRSIMKNYSEYVGISHDKLFT